MRGSAVFGGKQEQYRYVLSRAWNTDGEEPWRVTWVMLNPSTATANLNDMTIHQCIYFSKREGYNGLYVVNLFALRSSDPGLLYATPYLRAVGKRNDEYIEKVMRRTSSTIVAWGNHGQAFSKRREEVLGLLRTHGTIRCLGLTAKGQPRHPARLDRSTPLQEFHENL